MGMTRWAAAALAVAVTAAAPGEPPAEEIVRFRLLLTGNTLGYIEPCECSASLAGGLDHRAAAITARREGAGRTFLIDIGNLFEIPTGPTTELGKRQALFLAGEMGRIGYDMVALGTRDLQSPAALLAAALPGLQVDPLLTNRAPFAELPIQTVARRRLDAGGLSVDVFSVVQAVPGIPEGWLLPWRPVLHRELQASLSGPDRADLRIVVAHVPFREAERIPSEFPEIDLLMEASVILPMQARRVGGAVVMSLAGKGQQVGVLDISAVPQERPERGGRTGLIGFQGLHVPLPAGSAADPEVRSRMEAFRAALIRDGLIIP